MGRINNSLNYNHKSYYLGYRWYYLDLRYQWYVNYCFFGTLFVIRMIFVCYVLCSVPHKNEWITEQTNECDLISTYGTLHMYNHFHWASWGLWLSDEVVLGSNPGFCYWEKECRIVSWDQFYHSLCYSWLSTSLFPWHVVALLGRNVLETKPHIFMKCGMTLGFCEFLWSLNSNFL